ncbi:hypothetical protein B0H13DRAFT_2268534 [Mycena leptocephala]|nr:hypothetical protein B0H13DRAFT_2268534 [Mycena leptocephala]
MFPEEHAQLSSIAGQQPSFIGGSSNFTISDGTFNAASGDFNQYYGTQRVAGGLNYGPTFIVNCPAPQGPLSVADLPHRNTHYTGMGGGYSNGNWMAQTHASTRSGQYMYGSDVGSNANPANTLRNTASSNVVDRAQRDTGGPPAVVRDTDSQQSDASYISHRSESRQGGPDRQHSDRSHSEASVDRDYLHQHDNNMQRRSSTGPDSTRSSRRSVSDSGERSSSGHRSRRHRPHRRHGTRRPHARSSEAAESSDESTAEESNRHRIVRVQSSSGTMTVWSVPRRNHVVILPC